MLLWCLFNVFTYALRNGTIPGPSVTKDRFVSNQVIMWIAGKGDFVSR